MLNKILKIIVIAFTLFSFNFSARSDDTIKIAMIEPMSGPLAAIGLDLIEQMEFFAEKVFSASENEMSGIVRNAFWQSFAAIRPMFETFPKIFTRSSTVMN